MNSYCPPVLNTEWLNVRFFFKNLTLVHCTMYGCFLIILHIKFWVKVCKSKQKKQSSSVIQIVSVRGWGEGSSEFFASQMIYPPPSLEIRYNTGTFEFKQIPKQESKRSIKDWKINISINPIPVDLMFNYFLWGGRVIWCPPL